MNNIGRIVFGCISAVIIIAAIILLIPFGMSAENAKKLVDDTFANLTDVSKTAKYLQVDNEYYTMYFYDSKVLGDGDSETYVSRIDFKKATDSSADSDYTSGSVILGKMDDKWYVIKTATNGKDSDQKYYMIFDDKTSAVNHIKNNLSQAGIIEEWMNKNVEAMVSQLAKTYDATSTVSGKKAISGPATVTIQSEDKTITETLQISNKLIKKVTKTDTSGDKTTTESLTFKYNGELKMTKSLINGLTNKSMA